VPHITNAIQDWIERVAKIPVDESGEEPDVCIVEVLLRWLLTMIGLLINSLQLGGTVGDIESAPFIEAMRQFQFRVGHDNFALIHVSLVPDLHGEQKTKPTQTTVHSLRGLGLLPDLVRLKFHFQITLELFSVDRLPFTRPSTSSSRDEGKNFHVLSCGLRTGLRCT
jgi:CTP synthase